ncbi:MAG: Membrane-bound dipeptidase [Cyanobacteria bacterium RYN_339]|nr:Membrane-bound dipeptidase [Cyanobacteria bacterium RYN_339]
MFVDLHVHYPMHLMGDFRRALVETAHPGDHAHAALLELACRIGNYETFTSRPGATVSAMREGGVGVVLSVLYSPLDEFDLSHGYGAPPDDAYFPRLLAQLEAVERHLARRHPETARVCRNVADLDGAIAEGRVAFLHAIEGGFHLGGTPDAITANVATLAGRGLAYVSPAHFFWRGLATVSRAIPYIPDDLFHRLFPQPDIGLSELGRHLVMAMVGNGVLVDIVHMSERAIADTFALLDALDAEKSVPVIASHMACRFGDRERCLSDETIAQVAARDGVLGVILCEHMLGNGLPAADRGFGLLCRHIDRIAAVTGSHRYAAIGSDMDGFTRGLPGYRRMSDYARLGEQLVARYGTVDAEAIMAGNALRVLRKGWRASLPGSR